MKNIFYSDNEQKNRAIERGLLLLAILIWTYGFILTNPTIGVDDESFDFHFKNYGIIGAGRYGYILLKQVFDTYEYLPFWRDFIAILLLLVGAIIYERCLDRVFEGGLSGKAKVIFCSLFITSPVIGKLFVYIAINIEVSLMVVLSGLALLESLSWMESRNTKHLLFTVLLLTAGLSMIENSLNYYVTGLCMVLFLNFSQNESRARENGKIDAIKQFLVLIGAVVASIVLNELMKSAFWYVISTDYDSYGQKFVAWDFHNIKESFKAFLLTIAPRLKTWFHNDYYFKVFVVSELIFFALSIWQSIKKKDLLILVVGMVTILSAFAFFIITGNANLPTRIFVVFGLFTAFTFTYLYEIAEAKTLKTLVLAVVVFIVFYQSRELQFFFRDDYDKFEKDKRIAEEVYSDIEKSCKGTPSVPVVFVGDILPYIDFPNTEDEVYMRSFFRGNGNCTSTHIYSFFHALGYDIISPLGKDLTVNNINSLPENELTQRASKMAHEMPCWPSDGYVLETSEFIVVKLGPFVIERIEGQPEDLFSGFRKEELISSVYKADITEEKIYVRGTAFFKNCSSNNTRIMVLAQDKSGSNGGYLLSTEQYPSNEKGLHSDFDSADRNLNGFYVWLDENSIPPGVYDISIIAYNSGIWGMSSIRENSITID